MLKDVENRFIYVVRFPLANESEKIMKEIENVPEWISVIKLKEIPEYKEIKFYSCEFAMQKKKKLKRNTNCLMKFHKYKNQEEKKILKFFRRKLQLT